MNALRKWSIVPVALAAMFLFSSHSGKRHDNGILSETELTPAMAIAGSEVLSQPEQTPVMAVADSENLNRTEQDEEVFIFAQVEVKPLFNGKKPDEAFREYVNSMVVYPKEAKEKGITGRVFTEFIIDTDGSITEVKLMRGVNPLLDAEVLRVLKTSPKWTPGKHQGKAVKVKYAFPYLFSVE